MSVPSTPPRLVLAAPDGELRDHPELEAVGVCGPEPVPIPREDWIPVPDGSDLYTLPGRSPVGLDPADGELAFLEPDEGDEVVDAAAAFLAPAWTRWHLPAYVTREAAPDLPLYAYAALGFADDRFWTTGLRVDADVRQDPWTFDLDAIERSVVERVGDTENRVLQQLSRCALEYHCRAAQNFFLARHEAPLPASVACNAQCLGCISLQPDGEFRASHERLTRRVTPEEIAEVARLHWENVPDGVVSFGQGCEGEPLLEGEVLLESVKLMRAANPDGTIHLNSNASKPELVAAMADAGLDSLRISLNSVRPEVYEAYYRPRGYGFEQVAQSAREMRKRDKHVSTNLLYFPGVTDTPGELELFAAFAQEVKLEMVQLRNLNVDPELYVLGMPEWAVEDGMGPAAFMEALSERCPGIGYGYFNPKRARMAELAAGRS